uniref:Uncharacterized protein n=1 Tax=Arundo donax TaxID=35708 RepID=A0A0A9FHG6_ARUDO
MHTYCEICICNYVL